MKVRTSPMAALRWVQSTVAMRSSVASPVTHTSLTRPPGKAMRSRTDSTPVNRPEKRVSHCVSLATRVRANSVALQKSTNCLPRAASLVPCRTFPPSAPPFSSASAAFRVHIIAGMTIVQYCWFPRYCSRNL